MSDVLNQGWLICFNSHANADWLAVASRSIENISMMHPDSAGKNIVID